MIDPDLSTKGNFSTVRGRRSRKNLFFKLYSGHRMRLFVYGLGAVVEGLLEASALGIIGVVAIALANSETKSVALWWVGSVSIESGLFFFCGLVFIRLLVGLGTAFIATGLASRISLEKRLYLLERYSEAGFETTMKISAADLQQMLAYWPHQMGSQASNLVAQAANILLVTSMFAVAFFSSPVLAASSVGFVALFFALFQPLRSYIRRLAVRVIESESATAKAVDELANLQSEAVSLGVARELMRETASSLRKEIGTRRITSFVKASVSPLYTALALGSVGAFLLIVVNSSLDLVNLAPTLLIVIRALGYGQSIQHLGSSIATLGPLLRKFGKLEENFRLNRRKCGEVVLNSFERIDLVNACVRYEGRVVLDRISMSVSCGDIVGVVGPSGGGKTTLLRLMAGQIPPFSGSLKVNGVGLEELREDSFTQLVASVPQFPRLMSGSIDENVAFMRGFLSSEQIAGALSLAAFEVSPSRARDPNSSLRVGQPTISGGQAQRIGLARALAGGPSLLLLDEPTSAVDGLAQERIIETIESLRGDSTVVIVTHRPEVLRCCDAIYVIEDGRMSAGGSWNEVVQASSYFQEMVGDE